MSSLNQNTSSSASECAMVDEKKRRRMVSNRESARRSRMRKQQQMQDLSEEMGKLDITNNEIMAKIDEITEKYMMMASENNVLRAQAMELTERLRSLNGMITSCGFAVDATQVSEPLMNPWQVPNPMQAIPLSSGLSQF